MIVKSGHVDISSSGGVYSHTQFSVVSFHHLFFIYTLIVGGLCPWCSGRQTQLWMLCWHWSHIFLAGVCFAWSCESMATTTDMQTCILVNFLNALLISDPYFVCFPAPTVSECNTAVVNTNTNVTSRLLQTKLGTFQPRYVWKNLRHNANVKSWILNKRPPGFCLEKHHLWVSECTFTHLHWRPKHTGSAQDCPNRLLLSVWAPVDEAPTSCCHWRVETAALVIF